MGSNSRIKTWFYLTTLSKAESTFKKHFLIDINIKILISNRILNWHWAILRLDLKRIMIYFWWCRFYQKASQFLDIISCEFLLSGKSPSRILGWYYSWLPPFLISTLLYIHKYSQQILSSRSSVHYQWSCYRVMLRII